MPTSFTADMPADILIDTAVLYCDLVTPNTMQKFGGTRGGLTFTKNREMRSVPYDGETGETAGLHRYTTGTPTIAGTSILFASPMRQGVTEPGSTIEIVNGVNGAVMTVTPLPYREMLNAATDYHRWECLWKRGIKYPDGTSGTFKVIFPVGLATLESIGSQDNNEGEAPITIKAVNDPDDITGDNTPAPYFTETTGPDIDETYYGTGS